MAKRSLKGRVALITGASAGIGVALAREFARLGADVAVLARRADRLDRVVEDIRGLGRRGLAIQADVCRDQDLAAAADHVMSEWGRIDYVVANAGFAVTGPVLSLTLEDYQRQFATNVYGVIRTVNASRAALLQSQGVLAIVGSVAGEIGFPETAPYSMSKAAVHRLAESLQAELEPDGVAVTLIIPGYVESDIRQVDRDGVFHSDRPDPVPPRLVMPAEVAARSMVKAMVARRPELVLTWHGKLAVHLKHHAPWLIRRLIRRAYRRARVASSSPMDGAADSG